MVAKGEDIREEKEGDPKTTQLYVPKKTTNDRDYVRTRLTWREKEETKK